MKLLLLAFLLAMAGCGRSSDSSCTGSDVSCWCPAPQCESIGCIDGVAFDCDFYGDCADQLPGDDCTARGMTCWRSTAEPDSWTPGTCAPPGCGDDVVQAGEECDDGPENGTHLASCTASCMLAPAASVDQRNAAGTDERKTLPYTKNEHAAFQTFTAARSGRLAWIVAEMSSGGLFELTEDGYELLAVSGWFSREVDGARRTEHHFLAPVHIEAGRQYAFALECGSASCDLPVTRGDRYPGGGVVFRAYPSSSNVPVPLAPADADIPFETWVIEADDGCHPDAAGRCVTSCESSAQSAAANCIDAVWSCPYGHVDAESCPPM